MKSKRILSLILSLVMIVLMLPVSAVPVFADDDIVPDYSLFSIMVDGEYYNEGEDELPDGITCETTVDELRGYYYTTITLTNFSGDSVGLRSSVSKAHLLTVKTVGKCTLMGSVVTSDGYWESGTADTWVSCIFSNKSNGTVKLDLGVESSLSLNLANEDASRLPQRAIYSPSQVQITASGTEYGKKGSLNVMHFSSSESNPEITTAYGSSVLTKDVGDVSVNYILSSWKGFKGYTASEASFEGTGNISLETSEVSMSNYMFTQLTIKDNFDAGLYVNGASLIKDFSKLTMASKNTQDKLICKYNGGWNCHNAIVSQYATGHDFITYNDMTAGFPYPVAGAKLISDYANNAFYAGISWSRAGGGPAVLTGPAGAGQTYTAKISYCPNPGYAFVNMANPQNEFLYINKAACSYDQSGSMTLQFLPLPTADTPPVFTSSLPSATVTVDYREADPFKTLTVAASNAELYEWFYVDSDGREKPLGNGWECSVSSDGKTLNLKYDPAPHVKGLTTVVCYARAFGKASARTECKVDFVYGMLIVGNVLKKSTMASAYPNLDFSYDIMSEDRITGCLTVKSDFYIDVSEFDSTGDYVGLRYETSKKDDLNIEVEKDCLLKIGKSSDLNETNDSCIRAQKNITFTGEGSVVLYMFSTDGIANAIKSDEGSVYFDGPDADISGYDCAVVNNGKTVIEKGDICFRSYSAISNNPVEIAADYLATEPVVKVGTSQDNPNAIWNKSTELKSYRTVVIEEHAVSAITLTRITPPVDGEKPINTYSVYENYVTKVNNGSGWYHDGSPSPMSDSETFVEGEKYTFFAVLFSETGHNADENTRVTVNGFKAECEIDTAANDMTVLYTFTAKGKTIVNKVDVTNVYIPVAGAVYNGLEHKEFDVAGGTGNIAYSGFWDENGIMPYGEKFIAGKEYTFRAYVDPANKTRFDAPEKITATLNGKPALVTEGSSAGQIAVSYTFVAKYNLAVTGVKEPVGGKAPSDTVAGITEANSIQIVDIRWTSESDGTDVTGNFVTGQDYKVGILLNMNTDENILGATINGKTANILYVPNRGIVIFAVFKAIDHEHVEITEAGLESLAETSEALTEAFLEGKLAGKDCQNGRFCLGCGEYFGTVEHNMVEDKAQYVAPTATEKGKKVYVCSYNGMTDCFGRLITCTETRTDEIPATGADHTHAFGVEWKSDGTNHWHECTCGEKADAAAHTFTWITDKAATATEKGSKHEQCTECGYKKAAVEIPALGADHTHAFGIEWKSDGTNHWHECICGEKADAAAHTFTWITDKAATATEKGSKHEQCTECGYKKAAVEIPATGGDTPEILLGDVNLDGKVKANDARLALRYAAELETLNEQQIKSGDVNLDGKVRSNDARLILRFVAELITSF